MDELLVRNRIEVKIAAGILPRERPTVLLGGHSNGHRCAACDEDIPRGAPEIEAACIDQQARFYHGHCYVILSEVRRLLPR